MYPLEVVLATRRFTLRGQAAQRGVAATKAVPRASRPCSGMARMAMAHLGCGSAALDCGSSSYRLPPVVHPGMVREPEQERIHHRDTEGTEKDASAEAGRNYSSPVG